MKKKKYGMTVVCMTIGIMMIAVTACGGKKHRINRYRSSDGSYVVETQAMKVQTEAVKQKRNRHCLPVKCTVI